MSWLSRSTTDCPAPAMSSGPSGVSIASTTACDAAGSTTISSPTWTRPDSILPAYPR